MPTRHHINLITALPAEAKPLIKTFGLKRQQPVGIIPLYTSPEIHLAVSGPGVTAMLMGVNYLQDMTPDDREATWLNIGICGHGSLHLGEALLVERVIEPNGQNWQLELPPNLPLPHSPLTCVTQPQTTYKPDMAYDMESAGFMMAVTRFATLNSISLFKIVSDNPKNGIESINAKRVCAMIAHHVDHISDLIYQLPFHE
ncbi:MAG: hypothetical protein P8179_09785 [Candidatus Thiodiazotropha sp.]